MMLRICDPAAASLVFRGFGDEWQFLPRYFSGHFCWIQGQKRLAAVHARATMHNPVAAAEGCVRAQYRVGWGRSLRQLLRVKKNRQGRWRFFLL
jgi:hypothetical protein